jgi:hypothetical protein
MKKPQPQAKSVEYDIALEPISKVEWRQAESLHANDYNPNVVITPELRLVELSILRHGWIQPLIIR